MKLKDGHTYITRNGIKRVVSAAETYYGDWSFTTKSFSGDGFPETYYEDGKYIGPGTKHKYDLVKEVKKNAK